MSDRNDDSRYEGLRMALKAFSLLGGMGIYLVVFVGICVFLGNLADTCFALGYTGKLLGIIVGFPGAIYTMFRQLKQGNLL